MKNADMKVIAIILSIALLFTLFTTNAVSVASVVMLFIGGGATATDGVATDDGGATNNGGTTNNGGYVSNNGGNTATDNGGNTATNNGGNTATDNSGNGSAQQGTDAQQGGSAEGALAAGQETFDFYKKAVDDIKKNGNVKSHTRKEWQEVVSFDMGAASDVVKGIIQGFMKTEDQAEAKVSETKEDVMNRMCPCDADFANVASATTAVDGDNYVITIVMKDEETPTKGSNGVAAMATGILYLSDVEDTVKNDSTVSSIVKDLRDAKMVYHAYTIKAVMTKDGKFISIDHETTADLSATATVKVLVEIDVSGSGSMKFVSKWYDFVY